MIYPFSLNKQSQELIYNHKLILYEVGAPLLARYARFNAKYSSTDALSFSDFIKLDDFIISQLKRTHFVKVDGTIMNTHEDPQGFKSSLSGNILIW